MADIDENTRDGASSGSDARSGGGPGGASPFDPMTDSAALPEMEGDEASNGGSFTETTSVSWFDKLAEAAVAVLIGLLLVLAAAGVLFWNEGRAVQTDRSLNEGAGLVVDTDPARIDPARDGQLVHVQGDLAARTPVRDQVLGVEVPAARLVRTVEMYQWKQDSHTETHKKVGGGEDRVTTYTYTRVWSDQRISSEGFHVPGGHANPAMRFSRFESAASDATLGAFRPGAAALMRLEPVEQYLVTAEDANRLAAKPGMGSVAVADGQLYIGQNPGTPRVGDLRVGYRYAPLGPTSFIGRQVGTDLQDYATRAGDRLLMARSGLVPADAMFARAQADNRVVTWIIRLVATILMWVGFIMLFRPIVAVGDLVPFIGTMLGLGSALAAFAMTAVLAPATIATAWLFHRPLIAASVLAGGLAVAWALRSLAGRRRTVSPASFTSVPAST